MKNTLKSKFFFLSVFLLCLVFCTALLLMPETQANTSSETQLARVSCMGGPAGPKTLCGNGVVDPGEECDPPDMNGKDCTDFLAPAPAGLACFPPGSPSECQFDTSGCALCGDNILNPGEECDGNKFRVVTCDGIIPGSTGELKCNANCTIDSSGCFVCGNGVCKAGLEECDGLDFCGANCTAIGGYPDRTPGCNFDCTIDMCPCGDVLAFNEACNGAGLCDEILEEGKCKTFSNPAVGLGCSWDSDTGTCNGLFECDGQDQTACAATSSLCQYRRRIRGCWGPEMPCGDVKEIHYDFSGLHCSAHLNCGDISISISGMSFCDLNKEYLYELKSGDIYLLRVDYVSETEGTVTARKLLVELPWS